MSASFSDHMSNTSPHGRRIDILSILSFKLNHCSVLTFLSSYHLAMNLSNRPTKRRRTKAVRRVTEGDDTLADGVIVKRTIKETVRGPVEERIEVPIHCNPSHPTNTADSQSVPLSTQSSQIPTEGFGADPSEFFHPIHQMMKLRRLGGHKPIIFSNSSTVSIPCLKLFFLVR